MRIKAAMRSTALFLSSGDLIADRRYEYAREFEMRGDLAAAADVLEQALERAPAFVSAWFALGDVRQRLGNRDGAVDAFAQARAADPHDRRGAALRLALLGAGDPRAAMGPGYVQALFDQYSLEFDNTLLRYLHYRGPKLMRDAIEMVLARQGRTIRFGRAIDLGCGTGLMGEQLREMCDRLHGVDLSPGMIEQARRKGVYDRLEVGEMLALLGQAPDASADLIVAADALVYLPDLAPLCREAARVLRPAGLFAFTAETHAGPGVVLGEKLRYAHGTAHARDAIADAGLRLLELAHVSTRSENGVPVPGLLAVSGTQSEDESARPRRSPPLPVGM
jgi:predicted TPR repeat methyltransferase